MNFLITVKTRIIYMILLLAFVLLPFFGHTPVFASGLKESLISGNPSGQFMPMISGTKIIWLDNRNNNWDIFVYDLLTNTESNITGDSYDQSEPSISGEKIVWQDNSSGNWDIYMHDLATGETIQVTDNLADQMNPVIYGDKIVWLDYRERDRTGDIYLYNITTKSLSRLTTDADRPGSPAIYGDIVSWEDLRNGNYDIFIYDLAKGISTEVSVVPTDERSPAVYRDKIVWQDSRNGNWDIYMYDLSTGQESRITSGPDTHLNPLVYQDKIVWSEYSDDDVNPDVYMYDMTSGTRTEVALDTGNLANPFIYGDKIVWEDWRSGNSDIFMAELGIPPGLVSAEVNGSSLSLIYDTVLDPASIPLPGDFAVSLNSRDVAVNDVKIAGTDVVLTLEGSAEAGDEVILNYNGNRLKNPFGTARNFWGQQVTNITPDNLPPVWPAGSLLSVSGIVSDSLTLTWSAAADNVGITRYRIYKNGMLLTVLNNTQSINISGLLADTTYTFRVEAGDEAGNWSTTGLLITVKTVAVVSQPPAGSNEINLGGSTTGINSEIAGRPVTTVTVDEAAAIAAQGNNAGMTTIVIPVPGTDTVSVLIPGRFTDVIAQKGSWLRVETDIGSYEIPAAEINMADLARRLGVTVDKVTVNISIARASTDNNGLIRDYLKQEGLTQIVEPVEFSVVGEAGNKKVEINNFSTYIIRTIVLPESVDGDIAMGVVLNSDNSLTPVPTQFKKAEGKNVAVIRRKTNSIYTVISNKKSFRDLNAHWAKNEINALAAKLIIKGMNRDTFAPNNRVTRSQLAAIIVKSLGLVPKTGASFGDVKPGEWYDGFVGAAVDAGIIKGYPDGTFKPNAYVTREEVAVMLVRALEAGGVYAIVEEAEAEKYLNQFGDPKLISSWAKNSVAAAAINGIIAGDKNKNFAPARHTTRAEAAVMVRKMLVKAEFI